MNSCDKAKRRRVKKSTHETTLRIRLYYEKLGLGPKQGWTRERFNRLCKMVHCTPDELAALCCIYRPSQLEQWLRNDQFPPYVSLVFTMIESFWMKTNQPIMPLGLLKEPAVEHLHD